MNNLTLKIKCKIFYYFISMRYYFDAMIAAFLSALSVLIFKYLCFGDLKVIFKCVNTIFLFAAIIFIIINLFGRYLYKDFFSIVNCAKSIDKPEFKTLLLILLYLTVTFTFLFFSFRAIYKSVNPGYVQAIINTNFVLVFLASLYLYKLKFNFYGGLGLVLTFFGILS